MRMSRHDLWNSEEDFLPLCYMAHAISSLGWKVLPMTYSAAKKFSTMPASYLKKIMNSQKWQKFAEKLAKCEASCNLQYIEEVFNHGIYK